MSRTALVTGMTRQVGIARAVVERLLADGLNVMATGWSPHDAEMPWGEDPAGGASLIESMNVPADRLAYREADLADPAVPEQLVRDTVSHFGAIDAMVAVHARSSHTGGLDSVTVDELDACWQINTRGSLLLAKAFGAVFDADRGHGRVIFFTSGQHIEPMGGELAYAVSKGAIQQMTASISDQLIDHGVTVNCINPGPVDTGWAIGADRDNLAQQFPAKRWGMPSDVANLISFLVSEEGAWMSGQTFNSEGGFRRSANVLSEHRGFPAT